MPQPSTNAGEFTTRGRVPRAPAELGVDVPLTHRYGLDEAERQERLAFLGLNDADVGKVRELRAAFQQFSGEFADQFYDHLLRDPHTADFLRDPGQLNHLKKLQTEYFADLLEGVLDTAYFEGRLRVGLAHQRIGLDPVWYLGAYNQYIQLTFPRFVRELGGDVTAALPALLSLVKVIFLDIGLALRTYFSSATEQLQQHNAELKQALDLYWNTQQREEQLRKLLSHEVRGGLAAMITSLEDLLDVNRSTIDPSVAEQLESVCKRCWSLSGVLGEMLTAPGSGLPTWVDSAEIYKTLRSRFGLYAEGRSIALELPENAPKVWAEPLQLREVFANLVSNAVRYMDKEPGRVEVSCRDDGDAYVFGVADNGPGIPPAIRSRLFEPFVRGPDSSGRACGSGLGLYFVRSIIEQAGGRIWVESEPGVGTRFWFTVSKAPQPRRQPADSNAASTPMA
jgi:signal transduction histidine kinase